MRVVGGYLRGRVLATDVGNRTHPMSEKVRGALFTILGDISGLSVLDAFAGSGALSIEAASRNADAVTAIDLDKKAYETIKKNTQTFVLQDKVHTICANAGSWSDNNLKLLFDIVIAAPPYDNLQTAVVEKLTRHVKPDGVFVLDWPGKKQPPALGGMNVIQQKSYGDAQLVFYRPIE
ncbi:MAG TPA: RsmD family RNA methyltransferase [Candidatus Saccharimonadales bacterium]|nr:RsmD family RNA methyltransferase [Candidatus Saccharimonadales bacterium]